MTEISRKIKIRGLAEKMALNGVKVVITGANGFIGQCLVAALLDIGAIVTVLLRSRHGKSELEARGAEVVVCQLVPGRKLEQALTDQSVLFHFAYDVRASGDNNLAAFSALYAAAQQAGVDRIIHASSIVVYDDWPNGKLTEASPISTPDGGGYRQAKIAMERALLQGDMPAAILQPTIVYGPGSALWTLAPQAALRKGPIVLPEPVGRCAAVYVDDVVSAALLAARVADLAQERFIINGPDTPSWGAFFEAHARLIGTGAIEYVPLAQLQAKLPAPTGPQTGRSPSVAARVSALLRRTVGSQRFDRVALSFRARLPSQGQTLPDRGRLALYAAEPAVSTKRAQERLGYIAQFDLPAGMAEMARSK